MIGVLIVDDDPLTIELQREFVHRIDGFEVRGECRDARSAITAIRGDSAHQFDLVLLDVTMPDGTGLDVLRHVRAHGSAIDVIAISGVRDADTVRHMVSLGVGHYLIKPFTFSAFRERLENYREFRQRADRTAGAATQGEVDALVSALRPPVAPVAPKGLSQDTLDRVARAVREPGAHSASDIATRLGMSRVAARRYLEHLATIDCVDRAHRYGRAGRPETSYAWRASP